MPSRQTLHNWHTSVVTLQQCCGDAPLVVSHNRDRQRFEIRMHTRTFPIVAGRYEVLFAWISGYRFATATHMVADEVVNAPSSPVRDVMVDDAKV